MGFTVSLIFCVVAIVVLEMAVRVEEKRQHEASRAPQPRRH